MGCRKCRDWLCDRPITLPTGRQSLTSMKCFSEFTNKRVVRWIFRLAHCDFTRLYHQRSRLCTFSTPNRPDILLRNCAYFEFHTFFPSCALLTQMLMEPLSLPVSTPDDGKSAGPWPAISSDPRRRVKFIYYSFEFLLRNRRFAKYARSWNTLRWLGQQSSRATGSGFLAAYDWSISSLVRNGSRASSETLPKPNACRELRFLNDRKSHPNGYELQRP